MIAINDLIVGYIYKVKARNFQKAVYIGDGCFKGVREKFGARYIDREFYKTDCGGTVKPFFNCNQQAELTDEKIFEALDK